ncbi:MAG: SEL1-like repeat protein [Candidatus Riflebacteria bacterium]|nr:SEL1-like repeat protein [Candidatus Riflebacteria bacterium]
MFGSKNKIFYRTDNFNCCATSIELNDVDGEIKEIFDWWHFINGDRANTFREKEVDFQFVSENASWTYISYCSRKETGKEIRLAMPTEHFESYVFCNANNVNIRENYEKDYTKHKVIGQIFKGDILKVLEKKDGWTKIHTCELNLNEKEKEITGWVLGKYLQQVPPIQATEKKIETTKENGKSSYQVVKFNETLKKAKQGDINAQLLIGSMYYKSEVVKQSYKESFNWVKKAANQGNTFAQCLISSMYYKGEGVEQSYNEAFKWAKKAADQDDAIAQYLIGNMYANGIGVTQNSTEALKWIKKAADKGNAEAINALRLISEQTQN